MFQNARHGAGIVGGYAVAPRVTHILTLIRSIEAL